MIPTMVSRTPHLLMFVADGLESRVNATRMMAAAMTKRPEQRRRAMTVFCRFGMRSVHSSGTGTARIIASVMTLSVTVTRKFWSLSVHFSPGSGTTCQLRCVGKHPVKEEVSLCLQCTARGLGLSSSVE